MDDQHKRILTLLAKFEKNEASPSEMDELERWYETFEDNKRYTEQLPKNQKAISRDRLLHRINQQLYKNAAPARRSTRRQWSYPVFATLLILAVAYGLYHHGVFPNQEQLTQTQILAAVSAGGNRAILTLSNGEKIDLTEAKAGTLVQQANTQITKTSDGQIAYKSLGDDKQALFNTIETPRGGQFEVVLPDGSKAWLNAASSLTYPTSFDHTAERIVKLTGEAYFEVAHNREKPFRVVSNGQTVEVLGTHFNVNAYLDEPVIKTTLLEGKVHVYPHTDDIDGVNHGVILKPNQQSTVTLGMAAVDVKTIDAQTIVAWKDGLFRFNYTDLYTLMRQLARWYDIEVSYQSGVKSGPFFGEIERSYNLSEVLQVLALGGVKFEVQRIDGRVKLSVRN